MVLKIIGIVLLSILALILLILLVILFVPIRIKATGIRRGDEDILNFKAVVSFLLHILHLSVIYDEELKVTFRIFGIPWRGKKVETEGGHKKLFKKRDKKKKEKEGEESKDQTDTESETPEEQDGDTPEYKIETYEDIIKEEEEGEALSEEKEADETVDEDETGDQDEEESEDSEWDTEDDEEDQEKDPRLIRFIKRIISFISDYRNKTVKIIKKAKGIYDDADYYIALFNRPDTKEQLSNLMTEGEKLLKHLKPKVFKAHLEIGREDPYDTGKILSILSIIYPFIGNGLTVESYYDRDITDFDLLLKTRARVFTLLLIGYRVYFHKGFRRFLKALKHKER